MLDNSNFINWGRALSKDFICKTSKTNVVLEAFQDNVEKEAQNAGAIFCDTLNGKMISFPESRDNLLDLISYKTRVMDQTIVDEIAITLNAKSYSLPLPKPYMGFSREYLDIYLVYQKV